MIIGIDACNIRKGGGLTHLIEILNTSDPQKQNYQKIIVWSNIDTLNALPDKSWIQKETHKWLNKGIFFSFLFQFILLKQKLKAQNCKIAFAPGGVFFSTFKPFVTMSQNMLPFELNEAFRFKSYKVRLRFIVLRFCQLYSFKRAEGVIFLTEYAKNYLLQKIKVSIKNTTIIPHGIDLTKAIEPRNTNFESVYSKQIPLKLLYVSIITAYKHQWNVAEAISQLNNEGLFINLTLIGPSEKTSLQKLNNVLLKYPNSKEFIHYLGEIPNSELFNYYEKADAFIFASSCENLPIIMLEAMASGLPILSSSRGPMAEILGGNEGVYFDPESIDSIKIKIKEIYHSQKLRETIAKQSYEKAIRFSWENTAQATFNYLSELTVSN